MGTRTKSITIILALSASLVAQTSPKGPTGKVKEEGPYQRLDLDAPAKGSGLFLEPRSGNPGSKGTAGLVVLLHGHGSNPKNMLDLMRSLLEGRGDFGLSVQGPLAEGSGFAWDDTGIAAIEGLTRWMLANRPIDPTRVVLLGHSAGGTMTLRAGGAHPELFRGLVTVAAPQTPTREHKKSRVLVFLGNKDPNFRGAAEVRRALGEKNGWDNGAFIILDGAEHNDLPGELYTRHAIDWCLTPKARGAEFTLPKDAPKAGGGKEFRLVMVSWKGLEGSSAMRNRGAAVKIANDIVKQVQAGKAWIPFEAMAFSDHPSRELGGSVSAEDLEAIHPTVAAAAAALSPGALTKPMETTRGFVIVKRSGP